MDFKTKYIRDSSTNEIIFVILLSLNTLFSSYFLVTIPLLYLEPKFYCKSASLGEYYLCDEKMFC